MRKIVSFELELCEGKRVECKTERTLRGLKMQLKELDIRSAKLVSYNGKRV